MNKSELMQSRARGCMLGQLAGDSLGSLVEFQTPGQIKQTYPQGVRHLADGGTWNTLAGQPTDDSEMALLLARMLVDSGNYNSIKAKEAYVYWLNSGPFDCGNTIASALTGRLSHESQANGAMMRVSPLGIFGANHDLQKVHDWAVQDAEITHPNAVCLQANALFTMAVSRAVSEPVTPKALYSDILTWAKDIGVEDSLMESINNAAQQPPEDYVRQQGWVLIAFQNTLYQLLHAESFEAGVVDSVMQGGDTDTNAAICGALLGAVYGEDAVPLQWKDSILKCRPDTENPNVNRPRPECFWPVDAVELADSLLIRK